MSTILDALRKVEETHRTRSTRYAGTGCSLSRPDRALILPVSDVPRGSSAAACVDWIYRRSWTDALGPRLPAPEESQIASATGGGRSSKQASKSS